MFSQFSHMFLKMRKQMKDLYKDHTWNESKIQEMTELKESNEFLQQRNFQVNLFCVCFWFV